VQGFFASRALWRFVGLYLRLPPIVRSDGQGGWRVFAKGDGHTLFILLGGFRQAFLIRIYEFATDRLSSSINRFVVSTFESKLHVYPVCYTEPCHGARGHIGSLIVSIRVIMGTRQRLTKC
jgi:hypothetical protein